MTCHEVSDSADVIIAICSRRMSLLFIHRHLQEVPGTKNSSEVCMHRTIHITYWLSRTHYQTNLAIIGASHELIPRLIRQRIWLCALDHLWILRTLLYLSNKQIYIKITNIFLWYNSMVLSTKCKVEWFWVLPQDQPVTDFSFFSLSIYAF